MELIAQYLSVLLLVFMEFVLAQTVVIVLELAIQTAPFLPIFVLVTKMSA